jgi:hypothetical protein
MMMSNRVTSLSTPRALPTRKVHRVLNHTASTSD